LIIAVVLALKYLSRRRFIPTAGKARSAFLIGHQFFIGGELCQRGKYWLSRIAGLNAMKRATAARVERIRLLLIERTGSEGILSPGNVPVN
jgi:hypothetical protein